MMKKVYLLLSTVLVLILYLALSQIVPTTAPSIAMAYPPPPTSSLDLCEPNDLMQDAKDFDTCDVVVVDQDTRYIKPYISHYMDVDWYTFEITQTRLGVTVTLSGGSGEDANLPGDYDLAVFGPVVSTTTDVEGAAMFGNAMFGNAMFGNAMFGNAMFGNAMFGNAMFGNAMFGNAMFGNAMFGNAMFGNAMFGNAMFGNAMFGNAMFGNSISRSTAPERIGFNARNHVGTYHIAVWNGDPNDENARGQYRLTIQTGEPNILQCPSPEARSLPVAEDSPYQQLPQVTADTDTVILANLPRLEQYYGIDMAAWKTRLDELAAHDKVNGVVLDVSRVPSVTLAYNEWDSDVCDVQAANNVAIQIRDALKELVGSHTQTLKYVTVIGDDEIIPFFRFPDMTELWNEWEYGVSMTEEGGFIKQNSATFATLEEYDSYILTDDFYVDFRPFGGQIIPFERYLPDYAIGRLVETPTEIAGLIDGFLNEGYDTLDLSAASALVFGYDFLLDGADEISGTLIAGGIAVNAGHPEYIGDEWTKSDMETMLNERFELTSLNGHFTHWLAQPANTSEGNFASAAVDSAADENLNGVLVFSVGCHSGLNVPDENSDDAISRRDFAQVFNYKGATYIANTGFGYGESDGVDYSERLMSIFATELLRGRGNPNLNTIGEALRWAKLKYFVTHRNWKHYDDKVVLEAVLYGLPMVQVRTAEGSAAALTTVEPVARYVPAALNAEASLLTATLPITNDFTAENTDNGTYYHVDDNLYSEMHQPVQPLRVIDLVDSRPTGWTVSHLARGVLLLTAQSRDVSPLNPVIAQPPITDTAVYGEPEYDVPVWNPAQLASINRVKTARDFLEYLLVVPAQYTGTHEAGTERLYEQMELVVYYSTNTSDIVPPTIWSVEGVMRSGHPFFSVDVQDDLEADTSNYDNGIHRVVVTYLDDSGDDNVWRSEDLVYNSSNYRWEGMLDSQTEPIGYFVQAVDDFGNVSFYNNKSQMLTADYVRVYLPIIMKSFSQ